MKKLMLLVALLLICSIPLLAQDAEGCKDHPFFSRMPNFYIESCNQNFDKLEYYVSDGVTDTKEGDLTKISYNFPDDAPTKAPSPLQIIRNYENAIIKLGGKKYMLMIMI